MKKFIALILAVVMLLSFAACGKAEVGEAPETTTKSEAHATTDAPETTDVPATSGREYDMNDPEAVLNEITNDFEAVISSLTQKQEKTFADVGTTFDGYQKNKDLIDEWIAFVLSETDALFGRTKENSITYFKLIAADPDHKYSEFCDEAVEKYYDAVCDAAMSLYEEAICDAAMDALYNTYYNGIIDKAHEDGLDFEEWDKASNESYATYSKADDELYAKWSDTNDYTLGLYDAMDDAFCWDENFDVDAIVEAYHQELETEVAQ